MSKFANEKELAVSNIRKEIALNNDGEVKQVLTEEEYKKFIEDLDNNRDLTFNGINVMNYSINEIGLMNPEKKEKIKKLRILQTKIESEMVKARNKANNVERRKQIEEQRRRENERIRRENEQIIKKLENDIKIRNLENNNNKIYTIEPINIDYEKKRKEENLIFRGKIIALQEILRDINLGPEEEIITNKDLEDKGFIRPTLQINEEKLHRVQKMKQLDILTIRTV